MSSASGVGSGNGGGHLKIEAIPVKGYEKVWYCESATSGLKSIISVHNLFRGPACGGIRLLPYASRAEALEDVLRLSKGMSYKSALANVGFGGGKSVILCDPKNKTPELFRDFAEFVNRFEGSYICAKDMNITSVDLKLVKKHTKHVLGIDGEPGSGGDPSPVTARGIVRAMEATWQHLTGKRSLAGVRVALQGVGYVGFGVAEYIAKAGGKLWVTDIDTKAVERAKKELGATVVSAESIYDVECDIFAPCARGAVLNANTIPRLQCKAVVGAANNQLQETEDGWRLHRRGILYAPDYAANSGGIINVFVEFEGYKEARALQMADGIFDTMAEVFRRSRESGQPPFVIADTLAEERLGMRH
jgi:leucine dehydrogenase